MMFELAVDVQKNVGIDIEFLDFGGGIGLPYKPEQSFIDYDELSKGIQAHYEEIMVPAGLGNIRMSFECGRAITGPYGYLVTTAIHHKHIWKEYIGVDAAWLTSCVPACTVRITISLSWARKTRRRIISMTYRDALRKLR